VRLTLTFTLLGVLLAACSGQRVLQDGGPTLAEVQSLPTDGVRKRLAVAPLLDRTGNGKGSRITAQIGLLTGNDSRIRARDILGGMRDLLTTALFNRGGFILLEREGLDEVMTEQAFAADDKVLSETPPTLEGADLLLFGAVTAFDMGESGGLAFPIPIPLGDRGDVGILDVEMRTAYVAMDLRLVDVATGRLVASTAVEGRARKFGIGLAGIFTAGGGHIQLPGLLSLFANTPIEQAMVDMAEAASTQITNAAYPATESAPRSEELWPSFP